ncbi:DUF3050 domain-containing protein [Hymenobacter ginsengisoli]|uniref:DUF3050 domain-containing protein n=1 Tax=Hymenobacter ginsengisoli TaxID=1051626 RepID=A0ABP8Q4R1_9BACT|nr:MULTISPECIES: DUF3050 domain-containing protein [unclassified Hymenobacter]MBO2031694.1 DUF3050 domain-containing protein [Hymenobacter sp. BT559]
MPQDFVQELQAQLQPARQRMVDHAVYRRIETLADLRVFMEHHVYAVWDFMSLLKALQRELTCVEVPWVPKGSPATRRLINDIVLEEETDLDPEGQPTSHFELYLRAMAEAGADTAPAKRLLAALAEGASVPAALAAAQAPASVQAFVKHTFSVIASGRPHAVAAAFTFGREDVIPDMFRSLIADLGQRFPGQLDTFTYYLNRHIELDEDHHAPLAHQMVRDLCGTDPARWREAAEVAQQGMAARVALWDGIAAALVQERAVG